MVENEPGNNNDKKNNDGNGAPPPVEEAIPPVRWVWFRFVEVLAFAAFLLFIAFDQLDAKADRELVAGLLGWPFLFFVLLLAAGAFAGNRALDVLKNLEVKLGKDGVSIKAEMRSTDLEMTDILRRVMELEANMDADNGGAATNGGRFEVTGSSGGDGTPSDGGAAANEDAVPSISDLPKILTAKSVEDVLGRLNVRRTHDGQFEVSEDREGTSLSDLIQQSATQGAAQKSRPRDNLTMRLQRALSDSRFEWRSIERLALETGVSTEVAHDALASRTDLFRIGKGASGRTIARLLR